jgi:hypothetical protein
MTRPVPFPMRFRPLAIAALVLAAACESSVNPTTALNGVWRSPAVVPGSYVSLSLAAKDPGAALTGTGTQFVEAGMPQPFSVTGDYQGQSIRLTLVFSAGDTAVYSGYLASSTHIAGTVQRTGQGAYLQDFYKQ